MSLPKFLREPLVHFLAIGLVIYLLLSFGERYETRDEIVVSRDTLLEYVQFRTKTFDPEFAESRLDGLSSAELQNLIKQYQQEEALYREAKKLGLEQGDYVIRQRLVGKIKFLTDGGAGGSAPDEKALERYFVDHKNDYIEPASITFTHVFISKEGKPQTQLTSEANALLGKLQANNINAEAARDYGERFLFTSNYVDRSDAFVRNELGQEATAKIFAGDAPLNKWFGPLRSQYGLHLVYILNRSPAKIPALADIRDQVTNDFVQQQQRDLSSSMEKEILEGYQFKYSPEVEKMLAPGSEKAADDAERNR